MDVINLQVLLVAWILVIVFKANKFASQTIKQPGTKARSAEHVGQTLLRGLSLFLGQKYEDESLSELSFKKYALEDTSNDELIFQPGQFAIERAGFSYKNHFVVSDDGYVTNLIHLVNPLADLAKLKQPPVMLLQGGITDETIWFWGSNRQHHPEKWPRSPHDGPISSWNRSLAFTLANNGYDVWLVGTRGSTELNRGHVEYGYSSDWIDLDSDKFKIDAQATRPRWQPPAKPETDQVNTQTDDQDERALAEKIEYWDYTLDDLARYELPRQIDRVLELTGAQNVTLVPLSLSTPFALMLVAEQAAYRRRIHNAVIVAPIINNKGTNNLIGLFHRTLCKLLPRELGNLFVSELLLKRWLRELLLRVSKSKQMRYIIAKAVTIALTGPSPKYQTLLEPYILGHVFKETSFTEIKHYCQVVSSARLQKFDYGPVRNRQLYGSNRPPGYDLSEADFGRWLLVSSGNDKLATPKSVKQFRESIQRPPEGHIYEELYNHLDIFAAQDNDVRINLPILSFLDKFKLAPNESS